MSCEFDTPAANLLKKVLKCMLPLITAIVNKSVVEPGVLVYSKKAHVRPLIKKPNMDKEVLENYQPGSNLSHLSKVHEKVIARRLESHFSTPRKSLPGGRIPEGP